MKSLPIVLLAFFLPLFQLQAQELGKPLDPMGLFLELEDGGAINVRVDEDTKTMRIYQLDADGLLMEPAFARALVIIDPPRETDEWRLILRPAGEEPFLTHPRRLYPPYLYRLRIFLYPHEESDEGRVALPMRAFNQK